MSADAALVVVIALQIYSSLNYYYFVMLGHAHPPTQCAETKKLLINEMKNVFYFSHFAGCLCVCVLA